MEKAVFFMCVLFPVLTTSFSHDGAMGDLGDLYKEMREGIQAVETIKQELRDEKTAIQELRTDFEKKQHAIDYRLMTLEAAILPRHDQQAEQIAFSVASNTDYGPVTVDTNVPLPVVKLNIGDGWSSVIRSFQAPIAGTYVFTASIASDNGAKAAIVHADDEVNQRVVSLTTAAAEGSGDSNYAILKLGELDYVSLQLLPDNDGVLTSDEDYLYITFSGFLLFQ